MTTPALSHLSRVHRALVVLVLVGATMTALAMGQSAPMSPAFGPIQPRLSPDGKRVAYSWQGSICVMPVTGGIVSRLTTQDGFDVEPAWSSTGDQIAYIQTANWTAGQLRLIDSTTGTRIYLPRPARAQGPMFFSPDAMKVLGRFSVNGAPNRLSWYNLKNGEILPLMARGSIGVRSLFCLSRNGRWIVFAVHRDRPGEQTGNNGPQADLWRLSSSGGEPERITTWPARIYRLHAGLTDESVLAATDRGTAHNNIWSIPWKDSLQNATQITFGHADEDWPSTDADSNVVVYTDNHRGLTNLATRDSSTDIDRVIAPKKIDFGVPSGSIHLNLNDGQNGPTTARVSLKQVDGKFHSPNGALYRTLGGYSHFYCRDSVTMTVPSGTYELSVLRGPEYRAHTQSIDVPAGETVELRISLQRWTHAADVGWYSGENHIHANYGYGPWYVTPRRLLDQCEGEDLNICNAVVANSDGDAVFDREFFLGAPDPISGPRIILYWNEEFRSTIWGHLTLGRLNHLVEPIFTGFENTTNPYDIPTNSDIADQTRAQQGTVSYTHPASNPEDLYARPYTAKGLPVDAALGRIDTMDVGGFGYEASSKLWYRLLNCGFRIPAAAGTDCFLNRIRSYPPGWARAYVNLPDGLDYGPWQDGQREGRSFITNGPMIELKVGEFELGDSISLNAPKLMRFQGLVESQHPLTTLELIYNGRIIATGKLDESKRLASIDHREQLSTSGWIALRASGPPPPFLAVSGLWAHTNPIYVDVEGQQADATKDATYFLNWINRLERELRARDRMHTGRSHVQKQLDTARTVYRKLLEVD